MLFVSFICKESFSLHFCFFDMSFALQIDFKTIPSPILMVSLQLEGSSTRLTSIMFEKTGLGCIISDVF